jgi:hypothetical protein
MIVSRIALTGYYLGVIVTVQGIFGERVMDDPSSPTA